MKKFLLIMVLGMLWSGSAFAFNHIINVECTPTLKMVFDKNKKDISNGVLLPATVYSFNEKKEKLIQIDFTTEKDAPIFIDENRIFWHQLMPADESGIAHFAKYFDMPDLMFHVHVFDINRYSGDYTYKIYNFNESWGYKYLGFKKGDSSNFDSDDIFTKKFLIKSTKVLEKGIEETSNNIPQKDIVQTLELSGQCKKKEKKKKF